MMLNGSGNNDSGNPTGSSPFASNSNVATAGGDAAIVGSAGKHNRHIAKKLDKILNSRIDQDKDVIEALKALSLFYDDNTSANRRDLKTIIEKKSCEVSGEFLSSLEGVTNKVNEIYAEVESMSKCCDDMDSRLKAAKGQTEELILKTAAFEGELESLDVHGKIARAFLDKFQLSEKEMNIIQGNDPITEEFFTALERCRTIHEDCGLLMKTRHQSVGIELMEIMSSYQESGYEKLYRWAQGECRTLTREAPEVSGILKKAMRELKNRPILFKYCLDEICSSRRAAAVRWFIDALTRGGPGGMPKPIEIHSHDPLRYIGDMLAWLHQTVASERELLDGIFNLEPSEKARRVSMRQLMSESSPVKGLRGDSAPGADIAEEASVPEALDLKEEDFIVNEEQLMKVLSHTMEGTCRPFKVRVEQVISSKPGMVTFYKLATMLQFYASTLKTVMEKNSSLIVCMLECRELAMQVFYESLSANATKILAEEESPALDLSAPGILSQSMLMLRELLNSHSSSLIENNEKVEELSRILSSVIDPLLQMCEASASALETADKSIFMINCLYSIQITMALYESASSQVNDLNGRIDSYVENVVLEEYNFIAAKSGVEKVFHAGQEFLSRSRSGEFKEPMSSYPGLNPSTLKTAMVIFDSALSNTDSLILPQCNLLLSSRIRNVIRTASSAKVVDMYTQLFNEVEKPSNGYGSASEVSMRSPTQISTLMI
eukprot:Nk52_evm21s359 gene=Nk52_evmTU21s359